MSSWYKVFWWVRVGVFIATLGMLAFSSMSTDLTAVHIVLWLAVFLWFVPSLVLARLILMDSKSNMRIVVVFAMIDAYLLVSVLGAVGDTASIMILRMALFGGYVLFSGASLGLVASVPAAVAGVLAVAATDLNLHGLIVALAFAAVGIGSGAAWRYAIPYMLSVVSAASSSKDVEKKDTSESKELTETLEQRLEAMKVRLESVSKERDAAQDLIQELESKVSEIGVSAVGVVDEWPVSPKADVQEPDNSVQKDIENENSTEEDDIAASFAQFAVKDVDDAKAEDDVKAEAPDAGAEVVG